MVDAIKLFENLWRYSNLCTPCDPVGNFEKIIVRRMYYR